MMLVLFVIGCLAITYAGFCRLVHTSGATRWEVRASIVLLTASAVISIWAALALKFTPEWPDVLLTLSTAALLGSTSPAWKMGVPAAYLKGKRDADA